MASSFDYAKGPEAAEKDDSPCMGRIYLQNDLEAVKNALVCILQEENPLSTSQHECRKAELSKRLQNGVQMDCSNASTTSSGQGGLDSKDLSLLSRLLNQANLFIRHLKIGESGCDFSSGYFPLVEDGDFRKPEIHSKSQVKKASDVSQNMVEVASAAAQAAKAAAASTAQNLEVMESLLRNQNKPGNQHGNASESFNIETSERECPEASLVEDRVKKVMKRVEKQNRITHWVLGFMVITTAIWRFKMLSMFFGVRKTLANPFHAIGDMFSEGFKGTDKEEPNTAKAFQKARTVLPSLLQGGEKEITKSSKHTFEDFKIGEALTLSLDNVLSVGK